MGTARRLVERHLTDSCRVERDRAGVYDDVLDINTGQLAKRPTTADVVYAGPCLVAPTGVGQTVEGARVMERKGYRIRMGYDVPQFYRGDRVVITASSDPQLVGRTLVLIDSAQGATMDPGTILNAQDPEATAAQ